MVNAWDVTTTTVYDTVGATVTDADISLATFTVETYANRTSDLIDQIDAIDLVWIRRAITAQAAWLTSQPGYLGRSVAAKVDAGGVHVERTDGSTGGWREWADTLAPMAARRIKNLSWKNGRAPLLPATVSRDFTSEASDESGSWYS